MSSVASVSKTLTALGVMRLFESGRLQGDPDTLTLGELMPDVPAALADLTIHELLGHVSGLGGADYDTKYLDDAWLDLRFPELDEATIHPRVMWYGIKDDVTPDPALVDADAGLGNYSNAAYRILGALVDMYSIYEPNEMESLLDDPTSASEDVLGAYWNGGYEGFVRSVVDHPSLGSDGMGTACQYAPWREAGIPFVQGFVTDEDTNARVPGDAIDPGGKRGPSGGWLMTIGDLLRLGNGVEAGRFVSAETLAWMRQYVASDKGFDFGHGLALRGQDFTADGIAYDWPGYGHQGNLSDEGYSAMWRIVELPEGRSIGAAMMCNVDASYGFRLGLLMDQVYTDFIHLGGAPSPITLDAAKAHCPGADPKSPLPPSLELATTFGDTLKQHWSATLYQSGNDLALAERTIRTELRSQPEGKLALRAWDAGDVEGAARHGLALMWRRLREATPTR